MRISREKLLSQAEATDFAPAMLEKVILLLQLLERINRHPNLDGKLALKGGTALNLFYFDLPRLSVDIDLNYIGAVGREKMLAERPKIIETITAICEQEGLSVRTTTDGHAGISFHLRYASALGQQGNLKVDLNFMFRVPLWIPVRLPSHHIGSYQIDDVLVLDRHELAAGKLAALLSRKTSRDLFDAYEMLVQGMPDGPFEPAKLRLAFVVYGAINREDWRTVKADDVGMSLQDMKTNLVPLLRSNIIATAGPLNDWSRRMVDECQEALSVVLPLYDNEMTFLNKILDDGEIHPIHITSDGEMSTRLVIHPGLAWKALNVREFKKAGKRRNSIGDDIEGI
ncbi:MAG: nucleotidyl transferase AbiEii/AbiGii toxin family protein [Capsulimonadaceae bacterium]